MSFDNYSLVSSEADYQQFYSSAQTQFENSMSQEQEEVKQIFKENLPALSSFHTQQFEYSTLNSLKKFCSSPVFISSKYDKKSQNEQLTTKSTNVKQQSLAKENDVKQLINMMKKHSELQQMLVCIEQKFFEIESYLSGLKSKLQQNILYFEKYSSFQMKKILDNQMNKQILNHSLEYQQEIQIEKDIIFEQINQIKQEIKNCLVKFRDTPILAESCKRILMNIEEIKYSNKKINYSEFEYYFQEKVNSSPVLNEQDGNQSDLETQDTYSCLDSEINQDEFVFEQLKPQNYRLKVAFAGVNQQKLYQYISRQNIQLKDKQSFCYESKGIVAFSTAIVLASQKIPGIDLISLGCIGLIQSIVNFSNPHRTVSCILREQNILMSQIAVCGGLGLTGAALGQALIPVPVLGALVGGLVMEYLGIYISSKIKDWSISAQLQKQSNFFIENNVEVSQQNLDQYCDIMDIKKKSLKDNIVFPNQHLLNKLLVSKKKIETESPFGDIEKLQIYLLFCLQNIGSKIHANNKEQLGEDAFNKLSEIQNHLESFTEYFDFDYLSIGKNLHKICNLLKEKISIDEIKNVVEQIDPLYINGNNFINQQQESIKKYCKLEKLIQLLKEKNIYEGIIIKYLPEQIKVLNSNQRLDLWCTYICIQLLNPSYVFLDIFMMKVNFLLESKNLFLIDMIDQYFPIIKEMFEKI